MNVTNFEKNGNIIRFTVSGIDTSMANALRRTIISGVPVMAVEKITFYNNSSILNDEILAHRIGLVPLTTDLKTYNSRAECSCKDKGCGKCTAVLTMDVVGPKTVYSGDIMATDPNVKPVFETIPLVKIMAGQKVKMEAEAILGYGKDHIKWQPGIASYEAGEKGFEFIVESYGQLTPEELVKKAFSEVEEKISPLKAKVK
ncbi:MAG: DNA-directed RNA polymerase subunit D [Candidatus Altiarchaeota archaeon]